MVTFIVGLYLALGTPAEIAKNVPAAIGEANTFRVIFFILTFFSIGVLSDFKLLWQEGFGRLAAVYVVSLFGFVVWVGLAISWIFFHGVTPPLAGSNPELRRSVRTSGNISKEFTMSESTQSELREELRTASVEPLLPIEKKLIGWSLAIGLVLLAVLAAANYLL